MRPRTAIEPSAELRATELPERFHEVWLGEVRKSRFGSVSAAKFIRKVLDDDAEQLDGIMDRGSTADERVLRANTKNKLLSPAVLKKLQAATHARVPRRYFIVRYIPILCAFLWNKERILNLQIHLYDSPQVLGKLKVDFRRRAGRIPEPKQS